MTVGTRIAERCLAMGLKQAHLAERVGISAQRLNNFLHDRRTPDARLLAKLASALETTSEQLLGVKDGEVASFERILARVLVLDGIDPSQARTIARTVLSAREIAQSAPLEGADQEQLDLLAAHAAWLSRSRPTLDK